MLTLRVGGTPWSVLRLFRRGHVPAGERLLDAWPGPGQAHRAALCGRRPASR